MGKYILILAGLVLSLLILAILSFPDRNLHVVFCDVGQGDAILVTLGTTQLLVDGGPDKKVLSCLGRHLPFWDRTVEMALVTHPQEDHFVGFIDVVRAYKVGLLARPDVEGTSSSWEALKDELNKRNISQKTLSKGEKIKISNLHFDILNPVSGLISSELNDYSIVGKLSFGEFDALLTGDIGFAISDQLALSAAPRVEVLKVPHHGSKNGLSEELLKAAQPKLAVISVGKNNRYGHPHEEVITLLGSQGIKTLRTDIDGEIEVVSDGEKWWVNN